MFSETVCTYVCMYVCTLVSLFCFSLKYSEADADEKWLESIYSRDIK